MRKRQFPQPGSWRMGFVLDFRSHPANGSAGLEPTYGEMLQHSVFLPLNYEPSLPCAVGFQLDGPEETNKLRLKGPMYLRVCFQYITALVFHCRPSHTITTTVTTILRGLLLAVDYTQPGTPWVFGVLGKGLRWNRTTRTTQTMWGVKIKKNRPCLLTVKRTVEPAHSSQSVKESIMAYAMPNRLVSAGIEPAIPRTFPRRYSRMTMTESAPV